MNAKKGVLTVVMGSIAQKAFIRAKQKGFMNKVFF